MVKKIYFIAIFVLIFFIIGCKPATEFPPEPSPPPLPTGQLLPIGRAFLNLQDVHASFAPPWDAEDPTKHIFTLGAVDSQDKMQIAVSTESKNEFVYLFGYLLRTLPSGQLGWSPFTITGPTHGASNWLRGSTPTIGGTPSKFITTLSVANLGMPSGVTESVIAIYRCKLVTSSTGLKSWKCGCRTATDCGKWAIESFDICASGKASIAGSDGSAACCLPGSTVSVGKCCTADYVVEGTSGASTNCCSPYVLTKDLVVIPNEYACCPGSGYTIKNEKCCSATKSWVQGEDLTWGCCDTTDSLVENGVCTALPTPPSAPPSIQSISKLSTPTITNKYADVGTYNHLTLKYVYNIGWKEVDGANSYSYALSSMNMPGTIVKQGVTSSPYVYFTDLVVPAQGSSYKFEVRAIKSGDSAATSVEGIIPFSIAIADGKTAMPGCSASLTETPTSTAPSVVCSHNRFGVGDGCHQCYGTGYTNAGYNSPCDCNKECGSGVCDKVDQANCVIGQCG